MRKLALLSGVAILAAAGCKKPEAPASASSAPSAPSAPSDAFKTIPGGANAVHNGTESGDIVIGFFGSLTGEQATFGQSSREGTELAVEELNAAGGIQVGGQGAARKLKLISEDDGGKQEQATNVVSKLINSDKAVAIVGEVASSMSLAGGTVANDAGIPMVSGSSTNPTVTQKEFVFRVCFTDDYQGRMLARFAFEKLGLKTAALLVDVKQAYAVGLAKVFKEEYLSLGGQIVTEQKYQNGDVDLKAQLTAIKSTNPQVIFMPGYYNDAGTAARQSRELGISVPLLGGDGWESPELLKLGGEALEGSYYSNHYYAEDPDPGIQAFVAKYKKRFGREPDSIAALAYDATMVLAQAMRNAANLDGRTLRDALAGIRGYKAVTGEISFDEQRNPGTKAILMLGIRGGKLVVADRVAPPSAAPAPVSAPASAPAAPAAGASAPAAKK